MTGMKTAKPTRSHFPDIILLVVEILNIGTLKKRSRGVSALVFCELLSNSSGDPYQTKIPCWAGMKSCLESARLILLPLGIMGLRKTKC